MCSVLAILGLDPSEPIPRERVLALSRLQRHRGPDWSGIHAHERAVLAHNRLAIVDVEHGAQPLRSPDGSHILAVNGEIYNHRELEAGLERPYEFQTRSDCEVILALYAEEGTAFLDRLNGIFAFVLYDADADRHIVARDHIGIVPLYTGHDEEGRFYVASEMKALTPVCRTVSEFPPGHVLDSADGTPRRYYRRPWRSHTNATADPSPTAIREALEAAVHRQLMSDVPYGVLLSGGLDSSIIAAVAQRYAPHRIEDDDRTEAWWPRLHSFCIGLEGSPDLAAARLVADHIGRRDRETDPARGLRRLSARHRAVAAEGAVLGRRGLFVDRRAQGACGGTRDGPADGQRALPVPPQSAAGQGSLPVSSDLRVPLSPARRGPLRPRRAERGVLDSGGAGVGR